MRKLKDFQKEYPHIKSVVPDVKERHRILMRRLEGIECKSPWEFYFYWHMYGCSEYLKERMRYVVWKETEKIVRRVERSHFKSPRQKGDRTTERIIQFYEHAQHFWQKSPAWWVTCYTNSFPEIELIYQFTRYGVRLGDPTNPLQWRERIVRDWVKVISLEKRGISYTSAYLMEKGTLPSKQQIEIFQEKRRHLITAVQELYNNESHSLRIPWPETSLEVLLQAKI